MKKTAKISIALIGLILVLAAAVGAYSEWKDRRSEADMAAAGEQTEDAAELAEPVGGAVAEDPEEETASEMETEEETKETEERETVSLAALSKMTPYVGLSEDYIGKTVLGAPSSDVRHSTQVIDGQEYTANLYYFKSGDSTIFIASCVEGEVIQVWDFRSRASSADSSSDSGSSSKSSSKSSSASSGKDEYHASDYEDPEDFYYDYYDDFDGYEDAESYWEDAQR